MRSMDRCKHRWNPCMVHHDLIRSRSCGPRWLWFKTPCWMFKKVVSSNSRHELYLFGTHRTFAYIIHTDIVTINLVIVCSYILIWISNVSTISSITVCCRHVDVNWEHEHWPATMLIIKSSRADWIQVQHEVPKIPLENLNVATSARSIMCLNKKTMEVPKSQFCEMSTTCVVLLVLELFANQIWMIGFSNHVKQLFSDDWWHIIHVSKQTSQETTHWGDALPRKWLKPNKSRCRTRRKSVLSCFTKGKGIGQHKLNNWAVSRIIWFRVTA